MEPEVNTIKCPECGAVINVSDVLINQVTEELKQQGRTQRWLADKLGISTNAMHNICSQQSQSLERLFEIAAILEVPVTDLINTDYKPAKFS